MPSIGSELISYLKSKPAITGKIGAGVAARIWKHEAKQGVKLPYIVIQTFEGTSDEHLNGISGIASNRVQVDCYGATEAAANELAEAVRLAPLQMFRGTMGTTFVNNVTSDGSSDDGKDRPTQGGNRIRYWVSRDYILTYKEATQ